MIRRSLATWCVPLFVCTFTAAFGQVAVPFEGPVEGPRIRLPEEAGAAVTLSGFEEGHAFESWFPTGSVETDGRVARSGSSSLRLRTGGGPVAAEAALPHAIDLRSAFPRVWVRIENPDALARLSLQATGDDWDTFVTYPLEGRVAPTDAGRWLRVAVPDGEAVAEGRRPALVNRVRIRVDDRGGAPVVVHVDDLALVRKMPTGVVSLAFDDGWASQAEVAFPAMERFGFRGTAFVVPYLVGEDRYLSEGDLRALYGAGWDLSGHYHPSLQGREEPELGHILRSTRAYLDAHGFERGAAVFAYPEGYYDEPVLVPAVARHFSAARSTVEGLETLPPADPMRIRSLAVLPGTRDEEVAEALAAARRDRTWLILVFHKFVDEPAHPTEIAPATFERVLEQVAASGLPVRPMSEVLASVPPREPEP